MRVVNSAKNSKNNIFIVKSRSGIARQHTVNIIVVMVGDAHPTVRALNINISHRADVQGRTDATSTAATFTPFAGILLLMKCILSYQTLAYTAINKLANLLPAKPV